MTALVTDATSGIGRAVAIRIADRGGRVLVGAGKGPRRRIVAQVVGRGGQSDFVTGKAHDAETAAGVARRGLDAAGGSIDILVNDAGIGTFGLID
jgi:NAD(P)-dependent dehydrogenase (short-subunit alcohol dehydrogenase family)